VFAGPVNWTEKMTETELNKTKGNQTIGCGCFVLGVSPVAGC